ncbi:hypothetical protein ACI2LJ_07720 [Streptomyces sp. NPDC088090]|uniref:hypothetical protein n=1 Tax=Streptomyces sp. NPDC088090 TaxID=3365822 RepID=UPI00384C542E
MSGGVQEFVNRYRSENDGRDPFDDCLVRSGGVASWGYDEGHSEFLSTAVAEAMRLAMARHGVMSAADLRIDSARDEVSHWLEGDAVPGSAAWPAPVGEFAPSWRRLFLDCSLQDVRLHLRRAENVLAEFTVEAQGRHPETVATFGNSTKEFFNPVTGVKFYGIA